MTTVFDRYLLRRYLYVFSVLFVCVLGLFVVIDGFTNVDAFQEQASDSSEVLALMSGYYLVQSSMFFNLTAPILAVISAMVVFAMLVKHSELLPVLSAGVPLYRLLVPVFAGAVLVNVLIVLNRELVIPRLAERMQVERGESAGAAHEVEPIYDYQSHIRIDGEALYLSERRLGGARFVLPVPEIVGDLTTLRAREAVHFSAAEGRPAGWLLREAQPAYAELDLTEAGRKRVLPVKDAADLFVVTDVDFDQLHNRNRSYQFSATPDLVRRIHNPAFGQASVRSIAHHIHERLVSPLSNVLCVLVVVPLVARRESRSLVGNMALCTAVLIVLYGSAQGCAYLARANMLSTDLAAWLPAIATGTLGAWLSGYAQT
ncbi:MAG: LptF/LptG family permease [Planctomycetes bacterium]|nr:LptF/LptG family permease [Planctomycetota bacterium]